MKIKKLLSLALAAALAAGTLAACGSGSGGSGNGGTPGDPSIDISTEAGKTAVIDAITGSAKTVINEADYIEYTDVATSGAILNKIKEGLTADDITSAIENGKINSGALKSCLGMDYYSLADDENLKVLTEGKVGDSLLTKRDTWAGALIFPSTITEAQVKAAVSEALGNIVPENGLPTKGLMGWQNLTYDIDFDIDKIVVNEGEVGETTAYVVVIVIKRNTEYNFRG